MTTRQFVEASVDHLDEVATWPTSQEECDIWSGRKVRFPIDRARLLTEIGFDSNRNHALTEAGELLAFGQTMFRFGGRVHLARIIVSPEHRGKKLGELFVEMLIEQARGAARRAVSLNVDCGNTRAERLYEGLGFAYVARPTGDAYTPNCRYMELELK